MRKIFMLCSLLFTYTLAFSQSNVLDINLANGSKMEFNIEDIQRIDFANVTDIHDLKKIQKIVKSFKLLQNYPNPFNPSTQIEYEIAKPGHVSLTIYDLTGKKVKTIFDNYQTKGRHSVQWNGENDLGQKVSSGMYVYTVAYGNNVYSKKMIMVK